jgi:Ca-activated chloride channel family protein
MVALSGKRNLPNFLSVFPLILLLLATPRAWPQSPEPPKMAPHPAYAAVGTQSETIHVEGAPRLDAHVNPLRVNVDLALVSVAVTDEMNHVVTSLKKEAFTLFENGIEQEIQQFSTEDGPISVGLILDFSKSMSNKMESQRAAVEAFFQNANPDDEYFVVTVSNHPQLIAERTQSIHSIQSALGELTPAGSTALLDAIYLGADHMRHARYPRRALLIISDGGDNHSRYRLRDVKGMIQESDIQAYAIGLFDTVLFKTYEEFMGKKWLGQITDATGGRTVTVDNLAGLPEAAAGISWELRNQYVLGYRPRSAENSDERRKIKVRVTDRAVSSSALHAYYRQRIDIFR